MFSGHIVSGYLRTRDEENTSRVVHDMHAKDLILFTQGREDGGRQLCAREGGEWRERVGKGMYVRWMRGVSEREGVVAGIG